MRYSNLSKHPLQTIGIWLIGSLGGCATSTTVVSERCDVTLDQAEPAIAGPQETVVLYGSPFTEAYDTVVFVGTTAAEVESAERDCDECDECREEALCTECDDCDDCATECNTCLETVTFLVPDVEDGETKITLLNAHGRSNELAFTVFTEIDTGTDTAGDTATDTADTAAHGDTATSSDTAATNGDTATSANTDTAE